MAKKLTQNEIAASLKKQVNTTAIQAEIYKKSYYEFYVAAFKNVLEPHTPYVENPIIKWLCGELEKVIDRIGRGEKKDRDIIINIPPRTSKSLVCSICLNPWAWAKYPHLRFITASYASSLSTELAVKSRNILQSEWYKTHFPNVKLSEDSNNKTSYTTTATGERNTTSVGSGVTGKGADIIVIDDPTTPEDSASQLELTRVQRWYDETIENRINNSEVGVRIIVMQRLAEEDLTGYLLKNYPEQFRHICAPAELDDNVYPPEIEKLYQNGLFDPIRLGEHRLNFLRKKPYTFAGQYQQKPAPAGGGLFKKESFDVITYGQFLELSKDHKVDWHFFLDTAYTDKKSNDPSAILVAAKVGNIIYVRDVQTEHLIFPELIKYLKNYIPRYSSPASKVHIEGKASGQSLIQQLRQDTDYLLVEMQPGKDSKFVRAESISPFVESKRVVLIEGSYVDNFLQQVMIFPNGKNDDMVDTLVYAVKQLETTKNKVLIGYV